VAHVSIAWAMPPSTRQGGVVGPAATAPAAALLKPSNACEVVLTVDVNHLMAGHLQRSRKKFVLRASIVSSDSMK
jgi:hypothetical protein